MIKNITAAELPRTLDQAVDKLVSELPLKFKAKMANMSENNLVDLRLTLGIHIRNAFRLDAGNQDLLESCRDMAQDKYLHHSQAPYIIIKRLWQRLRETHRLRVVHPDVS